MGNRVLKQDWTKQLKIGGHTGNKHKYRARKIQKGQKEQRTQEETPAEPALLPKGACLGGGSGRAGPPKVSTPEKKERKTAGYFRKILSAPKRRAVGEQKNRLQLQKTAGAIQKRYFLALLRIKARNNGELRSGAEKSWPEQFR